MRGDSGDLQACDANDPDISIRLGTGGPLEKFQSFAEVQPPSCKDYKDSEAPRKPNPCSLQLETLAPIPNFSKEFSPAPS